MHFECHGTGDEPRGDTGALRQTVRNVGGERGHHQVSTVTAYGVQYHAQVQGPVGAVEIKEGGVLKNTLPGGLIQVPQVWCGDCLKDEAQRHNNTARSNERDHVRHTGHHGLVDARTPRAFNGGGAVLSGGGSGGHPLTVGVLGLGQGLIQHGFGLVNTAFNRGLHVGLTGEAVAVTHIHGDRKHHGVGFINIGLGEGLITGGALGFDLEVVAEVFRRVFERVGGHVGVGDAGGAGGDGHDFLFRGCRCGVLTGGFNLCRCLCFGGLRFLVAAFSGGAALRAGGPGCRCGRRVFRSRVFRGGALRVFFRVPAAERPGDQFHDLFGGFCLAQGCGE